MSKISELSDGGVIQGGDTLIAVRSGGNVKVTYGGTTTANIDGGTIDGTVIGGTTPAAGSFTTGSFTGDVSFGDNDKAIFGAGSDLQIFHSGTQSFIQETGTGNLILQADEFLVQNTAGNANYIRCQSSDESVQLRFGGATKLSTKSTGIDVTGTVTADGLTVGTSTITETTNDLTINATDDLFLEANGNRVFQAWDNGSLQYVAITNGSQNLAEFNSNGDISFYEDTGTTAKMVWKSADESLGIGTSSPSRVLHVEGTVATFGDTQSVLQLSDDTAMAAGVGGGLIFAGKALTGQSDSNTIFAGIHGEKENGTSGNTSGAMVFSTRTSGSNPAERMRIGSAGNVSIGTTSTGGNSALTLSSGTFSIGIKHFANNGQTSNDFEVGGSSVGSITHTTTSTAYNTSSDERLKDNITDAPSASDDIDAIQVRSFDWKADGSHQKYGMVAQELQSVAPEAVSGDADSDDMMGVDYSKLVPMLVKEIQSLRARVAQLEGVN